MIMKFCCDEFRKEIQDKNPDGHFKQDENGTWNILGCCGGCYVITEMKFCPFCGNRLTE